MRPENGYRMIASIDTPEVGVAALTVTRGMHLSEVYVGEVRGVVWSVRRRKGSVSRRGICTCVHGE